MKKILFLLLCAAVILAACSCGSDKGAGAQALAASPKVPADMDAVLTSFGLEETMLVLTREEILFIYGFEDADLKQASAAIHESGIQCDEFVLVEAVSEQAADRVEELLGLRLKQKANEMRDYLPEQYDIITKCSVYRDGLYTALIVSPQAESFTKLFKEAIG